MKKIFLLLLLAAGLSSQAQFTTADLQATGLTCAMCSNSINKALLKLPYVASVKPDIKNSSFHIVFKNSVDANIDGIKNAVEGAGFSVGHLKLTGKFDDAKIGGDKHVIVGGSTLHFVGASEAVLNGEKTIQVVDKGFLSPKQYRKYSAEMTDQPCCAKTEPCCTKDANGKMVCAKDCKAACCSKDGKPSQCCSKDDVAASTRIYHVTI